MDEKNDEKSKLMKLEWKTKREKRHIWDIDGKEENKAKQNKAKVKRKEKKEGKEKEEGKNKQLRKNKVKWHAGLTDRNIQNNGKGKWCFLKPFDDNQFNNEWENKLSNFLMYWKNNYIFASIH